MAGLVPATHVLVQRQRQVFLQRDGVDGRDKHGHDGGGGVMLAPTEMEQW